MGNRATQYSHTQQAPLHYLIELAAFAALVAAWLVRGDAVAVVILATVALVALVFALAFRTLTVADEGESLSIRFGPLSLFSNRIAYADITSVRSGRSSWIDGWGIHWIPWRGWTYNVWGFDCAVLDVGGKTIRIGSDDVEGLVAFLKDHTEMSLGMF
jgi:hypothetical protein